MAALLIAIVFAALLWSGGWPLWLGIVACSQAWMDGAGTAGVLLTGAAVWFALALLRAIARS